MIRGRIRDSFAIELSFSETLFLRDLATFSRVGEPSACSRHSLSPCGSDVSILPVLRMSHQFFLRACQLVIYMLEYSWRSTFVCPYWREVESCSKDAATDAAKERCRMRRLAVLPACRRRLRQQCVAARCLLSSWSRFACFGGSANGNAWHSARRCDR